MTLQEAYKKITSSPELKAKALEALKSGKGDEFLKEQGIDLTVEQIKEALQPKKSGELSRDELDLAAGGGCDKNACSGLWSGATLGLGCVVSVSTTGDTTCW